MSAQRRGVVVIGGGPAGLAAAVAAKEAGCEDVLVVERDGCLGGILNQCVHDGFGLHRFNEALSGPEYAARYIDMAAELGVDAELGTIALGVSGGCLLLSRLGVMYEVRAGAVVLATGCRERARGALSIPGHRPSGVYTAGVAQRLVNMENIMPGRRAVILGSGDIGLIMARRMTIEGARVEAVFEMNPYSSGLPRNIQQCLVDYGIPLYLNSTIVDITGMGRLEGVKVAEAGPGRRPVPGTERFVPCDTLLLSVGLIPENELARDIGVLMDPATGGPVVDNRCMTSEPGVFSCGNALHVHDLADWVSEEAAVAGRAAAEYAAGMSRDNNDPEEILTVSAGPGVRCVTPSLIRPDTARLGVPLYIRVLSPMRDGVIELAAGGAIISRDRRRRLHPSEMARVQLEPEDIRAALDAGAGSLEARVG